MKILENQEAQIISLGESTLEDAEKLVEIAGRTCYKSLDRITEGSAHKFVEMMKKSRHLSTTEHATIYLKFDYGDTRIPAMKYYAGEGGEFVYRFMTEKNVSKFSNVVTDKDHIYITTNYRVILENNLEGALKYQCAYETGHHVQRITVRLITNLQILGEFTRHRTFSFNVESTRYCNYSKDKFDNDITFLRPKFGIYASSKEAMKEWESAMEKIEYKYMKLAKLGATAQECAQVLPKATKVEMVMTATLPEWEAFFDLRLRGTTGAPHPQAKEAAQLIYDQFKRNNVFEY